jgi:hypothetical protein
MFPACRFAHAGYNWSALIGAEGAGRVMAIMGAVMILLRLVTRTAVSFKAQA